MLYTYKALKQNKIKKGEIEASSIGEVTDFLKTNSFFPIEVHEKKTLQMALFSQFTDRVSFTDITYMTRQFAIMLNAGLTLIDAIELLIRQTNKTPVKKLLQDLDSTLRSGKTFSDALSNYPHYFSTFYIALIKSGEASGKIDLILSKLAEHLEKQREFTGKLKNALVYPGVIVSLMLVMMFGMFTFVMPQIMQLYSNFQVDLPRSTLIVMGISQFLTRFWLLLIVLIGGLAYGVRKYLALENSKRLVETYALKIPVLGNVIMTAALVDVTRTLSILISSGVPILDGLHIVTEINSRLLFKDAFERVTQKVEKGFSIGNSMSNEPLFPPSLVQMTIVGEQTGHLDDTLLKISEYYQMESESAIKSMLALIDPAILIVLGLFVGLLVFAVLSPIFNLAGSIQ